MSRRPINNPITDPRISGVYNRSDVADEAKDPYVLPGKSGGTKINNEVFESWLNSLKDGDSLSQSLYNILSEYSGRGLGVTTERTDMLYQYMLQTLTAQDQRKYDKEMLDDSRAYSSPSAIIERLMAAGMSRDAALQAAASNGAAGSSGANAIGSGSSATAPSVSAPSGTALNNTLNTAFNGLQAATNLASFGLSIPGQLAQNQVLQLSADATAQSQKVLYSVNSGVNALYDCVDQGLISIDDADAASRGSRQMMATLRRIADKYPTSAAANFVATEDFKNLSSPYAGRVASEAYTQRRLGDDYAMNLAHEFRMQRGAEKLQSIEIDQANEELQAWMNKNEMFFLEFACKYWELGMKPYELKNMLIESNLNQSILTLNEQEAKLFGLKKKALRSEINLNYSQSRLNMSGANLNNSMARLNNANAWQVETSNRITDNALKMTVNNPLLVSNNGSPITGESVLSSALCHQYIDNCLTYAGLTNPGYRKTYMDNLKKQQDFLATDFTFKTLYVADMYSKYGSFSPGVKGMLHGAQLIMSNPLTGGASGINNALNTGTNAAGTAAMMLKYLPK